MRKILPYSLLLIVLMTLTQKSQGQVVFGTIEDVPYGLNSLITVPFQINLTSACFNGDNKFELYLSDANGNFGSERKIGEYSGFYSTFINGRIPATGIPAGDNYKLRLKSTNPSQTFEYTGTIKIRAVTGPTASVTASNPNQYLDAETFGWCGSAVGENKSLQLADNSTAPTTVRLFLTDHLKGTTEEIQQDDSGFSIENIAISYYTIKLVSQRTVGGEAIYSVRSYLMLNSRSNINIGNLSSVFGCIDPTTGQGAAMRYRVNAAGENGIQNNYPGSIYRINWGDGLEEIFTHCELLNKGGTITHNYMKPSCGQPPIFLGGDKPLENSYRVTATAINSFCQSAPVAASSYSTIYQRPTAAISPVPAACVNTIVTFNNNTKGGYNTDCSETMQYQWYVDGVRVSTAAVLRHRFLTTGVHTVRLVASSDAGSCSPSEDTKTICIQNPPEPSFNFNGAQGATACAPARFKPTNTSIIDENCNPNNAYQWSVTGGTVTYENGTNATSKEPEFSFSTPGVYKIRLSINTASCGKVTTPEQTIIINTSPQISLSPDVVVCSPTTYDFSETTNGPTKTIFSGTFADLSDTYTWTVTGGLYSFEGGSSVNSKYPSISFKENNTYTITVTHKNNCGSATSSQQITFTPSPQISAGPDQTVCYNDQIVLQGSITGTADSYLWTGGNGTFSDNTALNTTYTPTSEERESGQVILMLKAVTGLTGPCAIVNDEVAITVSPNAKAEITFTQDMGCAPFVIDKNVITAVDYPDRNATYTWYANGNQIGTGITFPGYTLNNNDETVEIRLVVTSKLGCAESETTKVFSTRSSISASFTQSANTGCGPLQVTFVNTSSTLTGATFKWDFGNGQTSSQIMPDPVSFLANPSGRDTTYTVTLQAITPCGVESFSTTVTVTPEALSAFSPDKTVGCSPMRVNFSNTSPGGTNTYYFDFGDGTTLTTDNKDNVTHTYVTSTLKEYVVMMIAENACGRDTTQYTIQVSPNTVLPELVVNSNEKIGCAPFTVRFYNNSRGANSFVYDFGDGNTAVSRKAPESITHTFDKAGIYTVTLIASSGCSDTTTTETITVLEQPGTAFTADVTSGCSGLTVQFQNTSTAGAGYLWDFGDGTTSTEFAPKHSYTADQEFYTVTLTVTNSLGCSNVISKTDLIHILPPPVAAFTADPGLEITIPNYTFHFFDESTGNPGIWEWDFGDGTTSKQKDPIHIYADTGTFRVTLKVINESGCSSSIFKMVRISGVPGYLFVPNSFIPGGENVELRQFSAKGSGIEEWKMTIFNKWGEMLWETTELSDGRPVQGWDGTYRGAVQPQGIYYWKIDVKMTNGTEWKGMSYNSSAPKRTGVIHLIR